MRRLVRPLLVLTVLVALAATALRGGAAEAEQLPTIEMRNLLAQTVGETGTLEADCFSAVRRGDGVVARTVTVPGPGPVDAQVKAARGDWDLAIFDADGRTIAAGSGARGDDVATGWARKAGTLRVQACRRSAGATSARIVLDHGTIPAELARAAAGQKIQMVSVKTPTKADKDRVQALGFDLTEHGGVQSMGVILHGDRDVEKLRATGLDYEVKVPDLLAQDRIDRAAEAATARSSRRAAAAALPSGHAPLYRTLAEYEDELKKLAKDNPDVVRLFEMPDKTWEGRIVYGVEITTDPGKAKGKPAFFNMGVHHAREWPAGEMPMEWAYELVKGYRAGDQRAKRIVEESVNFVVPIINPDGFNASRGAATAPDDGRQEGNELGDIEYLATSPNEYRRKNCRFANDSEGGTCAQQGNGAADAGVDPNRNYGGLWGGPGAEGADTLNQTYRGPAPFSEPETRNVQWLVSRNHVMSLITNHTTAGLVLRAPGIASLGDPVDEDRGYKALGDAMALENGYFSQKSFELYDTTGTTEDWSYNVTGGFGFTFEIYCGKPNYKTGDCDAPAFHPKWTTMAKEWDGTSDQSNHAEDPGRSGENPFGMRSQYDGKGNREAYYIAAESVLNEARHSIIQGTAPAGATLRLKKEFETETSPQPQPDGSLKPIAFKDVLQTTYEVPASGDFKWHVNPSTRPIVAKATGRAAKGRPSPPQDLEPTKPTLANCTDILVPQEPCFDEIPFDAPTGDGIDNGRAIVRVTWTTEASDLDAEIYRRNDAGEKEGTPLAASALRETDFEQVELSEPAGKYILRVVNRSPANTPQEPYDAKVTFEGPLPPKPGLVESYDMTCEVGGQVIASTKVTVDRGQVVTPDLGACTRRAAVPVPAPAPRPSTCAAGSGFRSVGVTPRGRGLRFSFSRRVNRPVTVSVFQQSAGRRILGERLVARFTRRTKAFTWSGKATSNRKRVRDGYLFARYSIQTPSGVDTRRLTLRRSKGRFVKRPDFYRRATCDALPSFKVERPVFGGASNRPLNVSFRVSQSARVQVEVLRGNRRVRRFGPTNRRAGVTHRLRVDPKTLPRGEYRVRITVFAGTRPLVATLVARRL